MWATRRRGGDGAGLQEVQQQAQQQRQQQVVVFVEEDEEEEGEEEESEDDHIADDGDGDGGAGGGVSNRRRRRRRGGRAEDGAAMMRQVERSAAQEAQEDLRTLQRRLQAIDEERAIFESVFRSVRPSGKELHTMEWDLSQQERELATLETDWENEQGREQEDMQAAVLARKGELEELHRVRNERRRRIRRLLSLCQPVEQGVTYFFDETNTPDIDRVIMELSRSGAGQEPGEALASSALSTNSLLSEEAGLLEGRLAELNRQLQQERDTMVERIEEVVKDMDDIECVGTEHLDLLQHRAQKLVAEIGTTEQQLFTTAMDYLTLRYRVQLMYTDGMTAREEARNLQADNDRSAKDHVHELKAHLQQVQVTARRDAKVNIKQLKVQLREMDEELVSIREERKKYEKRTDGLLERSTAQTQTLRRRYEQLRRRHALEKEGYVAETRLLQKRLRSLAHRFPDVVHDALYVEPT